MIHNPLLPHPDTPALAIEAVSVQAVADRGGIELQYVISGETGRLILPRHKGGRSEGLWCQSCCEVFIRHAYALAYREFNFAPGQAWQCYDFDDYRRGRRPAEVVEPIFGWAVSNDQVLMHARLATKQLPPPPWHLNLAVVLEEKPDHLSYWALAHPLAYPDFHHPDAFVLELAPPC